MYTMKWGRNTKGMCWVTFTHNSSGATSSKTRPGGVIPYNRVVDMEEDFCKEHGVERHSLFALLSWREHRGGKPFVKTVSALTPVEPDLSGLRGCPMGCGRVLRSHERFCPNCVGNGESMYNNAGGF